MRKMYVYLFLEKVQSESRPVYVAAPDELAKRSGPQGILILLHINASLNGLMSTELPFSIILKIKKVVGFLCLNILRDYSVPNKT